MIKVKWKMALGKSQLYDSLFVTFRNPYNKSEMENMKSKDGLGPETRG